MHFLKTLGFAVGALLAAAALAISASGSVNGGTLVKVGSSNLGHVLVDTHGKTLYIWAHDKGAKSTCNGDCATNWPPFVVDEGEAATAGEGVTASKISMITRDDGTQQVAYDGWPLYYFAADSAAPERTRSTAASISGARKRSCPGPSTASRSAATTAPVAGPGCSGAPAQPSLPHQHAHTRIGVRDRPGQRTGHRLHAAARERT